MDFTKISFPGMGIDAFEIPTHAFSIGNVKISWTMLILTLGAILVFFYAAMRAKKAEGVSMPRMLAIGVSSALVGLIFARGAHVLATLNTVAYESFSDVVAFWDGGLSFVGGLLGCIVGALIVGDVLKYRSARVLDALLPAVLLLQVIASAATLLNATPTVAVADTSVIHLFCAPIEFALSDGSLLNTIRMEVARGGEVIAYHPLFLYQLIWNLVAFVAVHLTYRRRRFSGHTALVYTMFLGFGWVLQGMITPVDGACSPMQWAGLILFVGALIACIVYCRRAGSITVAVEGEIPEHRTFKRPMTEEERAQKTETALQEMTAYLEDKTETRFAELNGNSQKEGE